MSAMEGRRSLQERTQLAARAARSLRVAGSRGAATRGSKSEATLPFRRSGTAHSTTDGGECWTSMALRPLMISSSRIPKLKTSVLVLRLSGVT
ncbi:hypothetical protein BDA96_09G129500 [Sorghum bicolor]|uniref:Uncharacterized protein n=1 Tax=Sorghum bicolor TaxID=4558 RepID=A0A921QBG6_SORBI|nr:hypothetical protein BDA96_09G129500 [Sorghum bicolor]